MNTWKDNDEGKEDRPSGKRNNILIVGPDRLGDTLLSIEAIKQITNHYPNNEMFLVCRKSFICLFELYGLTSVHFIGIEGNVGKWPEYKEFRRLTEIIRSIYYEKVFMTVSPNPWLTLLTACARAKSYTNLAYQQYENRRNKIERYVKERVFDHGFVERDEVFLGRAYKNFLASNDIHYTSEGARLSINSGNRYRNKFDEYILFSPMSIVSSREMSDTKMKELLKGLLEINDYNIVLSGNALDARKIETVLRDFLSEESKSRVINYAGKTSLEEFLILIKDAKLVIGVDSGQIHLAASIGTPSVALCGYWNPPQFLPYDYEKKTLVYPECIFSKKSYECKYCQASNGKWDKKTRPNPVCDEREKNGQSFLCLEEIDLQDVLDKVKEIMER